MGLRERAITMTVLVTSILLIFIELYSVRVFVFKMLRKSIVIGEYVSTLTSNLTLKVGCLTLF